MMYDLSMDITGDFSFMLAVAAPVGETCATWPWAAAVKEPVRTGATNPKAAGTTAATSAHNRAFAIIVIFTTVCVYRVLLWQLKRGVCGPRTPSLSPVNRSMFSVLKFYIGLTSRTCGCYCVTFIYHFRFEAGLSQRGTVTDAHEPIKRRPPRCALMRMNQSRQTCLQNHGRVMAYAYITVRIYSL